MSENLQLIAPPAGLPANMPRVDVIIGECIEVIPGERLEWRLSPVTWICGDYVSLRFATGTQRQGALAELIAACPWLPEPREPELGLCAADLAGLIISVDVAAHVTTMGDIVYVASKPGPALPGKDCDS